MSDDEGLINESTGAAAGDGSHADLDAERDEYRNDEQSYYDDEHQHGNRGGALGGRNRNRSPTRSRSRSRSGSRSPAYQIDRNGDPTTATTSSTRDSMTDDSIRTSASTSSAASNMNARDPNLPQLGGEPSDIVITRFLMDSKLCGTIIGKGGATISRIRNETGVDITLLKSTQADPKDRRGRDQQNQQPILAPERVMDVRGDLDAVVRAVRLIVEELVQNNAAAGGNPNEFSLNWMIAGRLLGACIGKGGNKIQKTIQESGCRCHADNIPLFDSTEKIMNLRGTPEQIEKAFRSMLLNTLNEPLDPRKETFIPYIPAKALGYGGGAAPAATPYAARGGYADRAPYENRAPYEDRYPRGGDRYGAGAAQPYAARGSGAGAGAPRSTAAAPYTDPRDRSPLRGGRSLGAQAPAAAAPYDDAFNAAPTPPATGGRYGGAGGYAGAGGQSRVPPHQPAAGDIVQQVVVPAGAAGSVIGKGDPSRPNERLIEVSGAPRDVDAAIEEIRVCVRQHEERQQQAAGTSAAPPPITIGGVGRGRY